VVSSVAGGGAWQDLILVAGKTYCIKASARKTSSMTAMLVAQRGAAGSYAFLGQTLLAPTTTFVNFIFQATGADVQIKLTSSTGGDTLYADNISVKEIVGSPNHAYQSTSASRPTLSARVNLATYSEIV